MCNSVILLNSWILSIKKAKHCDSIFYILIFCICFVCVCFAQYGFGNFYQFDQKICMWENIRNWLKCFLIWISIVLSTKNVEEVIDSWKWPCKDRFSKHCFWIWCNRIIWHAYYKIKKKSMPIPQRFNLVQLRCTWIFTLVYAKLNLKYTNVLRTTDS